MHAFLGRTALCATLAAGCAFPLPTRHPSGDAPERPPVELPIGSETKLSRRDLSGLALAGADLRGRNLAWSELIGTDLRDAVLANADLLDADMRRAKLVGADLTGASLLHADLRKATLDHADLSGADLRQAALRRASLAGARLEGARLDWADLRGADLRGANLRRATFVHADLRGADLRGAVGLSDRLLARACSDETVLVDGCGGLFERPTSFEMPRANRGTERYSAWFGDDDGRILYFGLSPFWTLLWEHDDDPMAELEATGDLLIGRFDLASERFLEPLVLSGETRGSVWDVLAHSSGLVCFSTYFEPMGCVDPESGHVQRFEDAGLGLNELYEGPEGHIYATRYSSDPERRGEAEPYASVVRLTPSGQVVAEHVLESPDGGLAAAKSLAVDPSTGEIWVNTDTFLADGSILHEAIRLSAEGRELERGSSPELQFVSFDAKGRGWLVEDHDGELRVRIVEHGKDVSVVTLGSRSVFDFVQDLKFAPDGRVVLASWSGTVYLVSELEGEFSVRRLSLERPDDCVPPEGRSLVYTAVIHGSRLYATLFCGPRVLVHWLGAATPPTPPASSRSHRAPPRSAPAVAGSGRGP